MKNNSEKSLEKDSGDEAAKSEDLDIILDDYKRLRV
jgi:hypothetical protein